MYRPVSHAVIRDALIHLRHLYSTSKPETEQERREQEARELFTRNLLSNLPHLRQHPMLHVVTELADSFELTLDGAHQVFGYSLSRIPAYDFRLNGGRTPIIESYPFERDLPIDLPLHLGAEEFFRQNALLREVVPEWQREVPIRALEGEGWRRPGIFYVQIGTQDSLGGSLPPGAIASVQPISEEESLHPDPRHIYLLQFGNGYRCCGCMVSRGKLFLSVADRNYAGPQEFRYPGAVQIAGRIRMFAAELPAPSRPSLITLPDSRHPAPLLLPWQQPSLDALFRTGERRFSRTRQERQRAKSILETVFETSISGRTERRYRRPTNSRPHVNVLIQLSLERGARYTDALRTLQALPSDRHRHSLDTLLRVDHLTDLPNSFRRARIPIPEERWAALRAEWGEWPALLSMKFPQLHSLGDRVIRLHQSEVFDGLDPLVPPGVVLLLEPLDTTPDTHDDYRLTDWSRPIYALSKGRQTVCGYLEAENRHYTLVPHPRSRGVSLTLRHDEIDQISKAVGIACPV